MRPRGADDLLRRSPDRRRPDLPYRLGGHYWTEVAGLGVPASRQVRFQLASGQDGGGTPMIQEGYHFWIAADGDLNAMRLTCLGMLDDMSRSRLITLREIRATLGDLATLAIAGRSSLSPGGKTSTPSTLGPITMSGRG